MSSFEKRTEKKSLVTQSQQDICWRGDETYQAIASELDVVGSWYYQLKQHWVTVSGPEEIADESGLQSKQMQMKQG